VSYNHLVRLRTQRKLIYFAGCLRRDRKDPCTHSSPRVRYKPSSHLRGENYASLCSTLLLESQPSESIPHLRANLTGVKTPTANFLAAHAAKETIDQPKVQGRRPDGHHAKLQPDGNPPCLNRRPLWRVCSAHRQNCRSWATAAGGANTQPLLGSLTCWWGPPSSWSSPLPKPGQPPPHMGRPGPRPPSCSTTPHQIRRTARRPSPNTTASTSAGRSLQEPRSGPHESPRLELERRRRCTMHHVEANMPEISPAAARSAAGDSISKGPRSLPRVHRSEAALPFLSSHGGGRVRHFGGVCGATLLFSAGHGGEGEKLSATCSSFSILEGGCCQCGFSLQSVVASLLPSFGHHGSAPVRWGLCRCFGMEGLVLWNSSLTAYQRLDPSSLGTLWM
jgi:hypothetical protein